MSSAQQHSTVVESLCGLKTPTMVVLHLDETNTSDQGYLTSIDRAVARLAKESDYFFVFVQTGVKTTMMNVSHKNSNSNSARSQLKQQVEPPTATLNLSPSHFYLIRTSRTSAQI
jgi:hypothetical protein